MVALGGGVSEECRWCLRARDKIASLLSQLFPGARANRVGLWLCKAVEPCVPDSFQQELMSEVMQGLLAPSLEAPTPLRVILCHLVRLKQVTRETPLRVLLAVIHSTR